MQKHKKRLLKYTRAHTSCYKSIHFMHRCFRIFLHPIMVYVWYHLPIPNSMQRAHTVAHFCLCKHMQPSYTDSKPFTFFHTIVLLEFFSQFCMCVILAFHFGYIFFTALVVMMIHSTKAKQAGFCFILPLQFIPWIFPF